MSFIYTRSQLKSRIDGGIQGKQGLLVDINETVNEAVRQVASDVRIRSSRRRQPLVPNLLTGVFEYEAPDDLHGYNIIDIPAQAKRADGLWTLVPTEEFDRKWQGSNQDGKVAIGDYNGIRTLLLKSAVDDDESSIEPISDKTTSGNDWSAFGDADNVRNDGDDYVKGNGSVAFDIDNSGGTTAGLEVSGLDTTDLSDFIGEKAYVFTYVRLTDSTDVTNIKLRLGTSSSVYYEFTATTRNDGTAFKDGWNLIRFDLDSSTTTGSPDESDITYAAVFMTKAAGKTDEDGYAFNWLVAKKGRYHDVDYYSKYLWQSSAGAYKENSTDDADVLVADTDEYNLFIKRGRILAAEEVDLPENQILRMREEYQNDIEKYGLGNPSEDKTMVSSYWTY